jgi:hypothetical protein
MEAICPVDLAGEHEALQRGWKMGAENSADRLADKLALGDRVGVRQAIAVPQSLLDRMSATDIVAHCVWDMTFYGVTQERIAEARAELDRRLKEIDEGEAVFIPWE